MISFFPLAPEDQSVVYLGQIFGYVGGLLPTQNASLLFGAMFKTINTTALILGAMLVVHTTVIGLLKTASEGEFLGKQWSSLWVPARMILGIASLFPTASGYSLLQICMMWFILQGVGAADVLWSTVINYVNVAGSPYAAVNVPTADINQKMGTIFQMVTCDATLKATYMDSGSYNSGGKYYYCGSSSGDANFCRSSSSFQNPKTVFGPDPGACGTLSYCNEAQDCANPNSLRCYTCKAQKAALGVILGPQGLVVESNLFLEVDHDYLAFRNTPTVPAQKEWIKNYCKANGVSENQCLGTDSIFSKLYPYMESNGQMNLANPDSATVSTLYWPQVLLPRLGASADFIGDAVNLYVGTIIGATQTWLSLQNPALEPWQQKAKSHGWMTAGVYYFEIARMQSNNLQDAIPPLEVNGKEPSATMLKGYRNNYWGASNLLQSVRAEAQQANSNITRLPPELSEMGAVMTSSGGSITRDFMNTLTGAGPGNRATNPLAKIAAFGEGLLITAQVIFAVFLTLAIVIIMVVGFRGFGLGTGIVDSIAESVLLGYIIMLPILLAFISALFVIGGTLAIYIPLIPYILFTFGVIGWFISTIEAMVAMPFVALGILSPGGHHELLGRAEPSIMIALNIFLRPTLMVFGLMAAMLLSSAVVTMINAGFGGVMVSINKHAGVAELILFIATYTFLITIALNKCFSLIHLIPEKVLTWLGGHQMGGGEAESAQQVKAGFEGAASTTGQSMAATAPDAEKAAEFKKESASVTIAKENVKNFGEMAGAQSEGLLNDAETAQSERDNASRIRKDPKTSAEKEAKGREASRLKREAKAKKKLEPDNDEGGGA